jgi:tRNA (guanosine-2'-O-)-methyltransferase
MSCEKWIDLHRHPDVAAARAALGAAGMTLCAAVPGAGATLDDLPPLEPLALWVGNEHEGLSAEALAACAHRIEIPMFGFTRSFNLSVSVALLVARASERRRAALGRPGDLPPAERAKRRARWYAQDIRGAAEIVERFVSNRTRE